MQNYNNYSHNRGAGTTKYTCRCCINKVNQDDDSKVINRARVENWYTQVF